MKNTELEMIINKKLGSLGIEDYSPNGLQVEGKQDVTNIVTGVSISQALLDSALDKQADAVIVHHGFFWKNECPIIEGIKRQRLKTILINDINFYGWHLPLDMHPKLGNNAHLAIDLNIRVTDTLNKLVLKGELERPFSGSELKAHIEKQLGNTVLYYGESGSKQIKKVALCSGKGQNYIEMSARAGVDAFITGEASEESIQVTRETGLHFYAAGHYATERSGIRSLGEWLTQQYNFHVNFIDIFNPV